MYSVVALIGAFSGTTTSFVHCFLYWYKKWQRSHCNCVLYYLLTFSIHYIFPLIPCHILCIIKKLINVHATTNCSKCVSFHLQNLLTTCKDNIRCIHFPAPAINGYVGGTALIIGHTDIHLQPFSFSPWANFPPREISVAVVPMCPSEWVTILASVNYSSPAENRCNTTPFLQSMSQISTLLWKATLILRGLNETLIDWFGQHLQCCSCEHWVYPTNI